MALLTHQQVQVTGPEITPTVTPGAAVVLWVKNGDASGHTVTITTPDRLNQFGQALPDIEVTVPDGGERLIGR